MAKLPVALKFDIKVPLGPYVKLSTTAKDTPDVGERVRRGLRQASSASVQEVVNTYFERARTVIQREGRRDLIAILDGLEKIPADLKTPKGIYRDEEIFVGNSTQLTTLRCKVVYTVRLALARSHYARLEHDYGRPIIVPMLPVRQRLGEKANLAGLGRLAEMIRLRVEAAGATLEQVLGPEEAVRTISPPAAAILAS